MVQRKLYDDIGSRSVLSARANIHFGLALICFHLAFVRTYLRGHLAVTNATRPRKDWLAGASSGQSEDSPSFSVWETELLEEPDEEEPEEVLAEGM